MAVVADGHGDEKCFRSAKGSKFAAESARNCISSFLRQNKKTPAETQIRQLVISIVKTWNDAVNKDFTASPFGSAEFAGLSDEIKTKYRTGDYYRHAYGTTLIAVVLCDTYYFGFHIGDGKCTVLRNNGTFEQPILWDERCYLNVTTSVCDDDAAERARIIVSKELPAAVFLCSDGLDDCYPVNDNEKYLYNFYCKIALEFLDNDFGKTYSNLKELFPKLSQKGSGDDTSVAAILDMNTLRKLEPILRNMSKNVTIERANAAIEKKQTELEKAETDTGEIKIDIKV
jgi:serine/threonine protein phosphatase PrpC